MTPCTFPACPHPPTATNRANQPTCDYHRAVVVSRDVADAHDADEARAEAGRG